VRYFHVEEVISNEISVKYQINSFPSNIRPIIECMCRRISNRYNNIDYSKPRSITSGHCGSNECNASGYMGGAVEGNAIPAQVSITGTG
jgi:hypothetical protein